MALSFPLATSVFADLLGATALTPRQGLQQEISSQGSGDELVADLSPAKREYDVTCMPMYHSVAAGIMALIEALRGSLNTFYISDPRYPGPAYDPTGAILGVSTVVIHTINANNKALSLSGLPANYVITAGDFFAYDYGSDPARRAYLRAAETVTASSGGVTAEFQLTDFVPSGSETGLSVTLVKPAFKAKIITGTVQEQAGSAGSMFTSITLSIRQVR